MKLKIKKTDTNASMPSKANVSDAGIDLYALDDVSLQRNINGIVSQKMVRTGIAVEIPEGYFGLITGRSGLAFNQGVHNFVGTIDSGYRGEIHVLVINHNNIEYRIKAGDRLAQLIILPIPQIELEEVTELSESSRGLSGFGSSGR